MAANPRLVLAAILCGLFGLSPARANVVGTDMQNFNATTSGLDFVTVQSSETLKPGIVNLGLFFNYAANTLPYFDAGNAQTRTNFNDTVLGADLNAGLGLMRNWDMGISFPQVLNQNVQDQNGARGEFAQTGSTEIRANSKYRILGDDSGGVALIGSVGLNTIQDNPWVGRNGGPSVNLEVAADTTVGRVAFGGDAGYRIRNPGTQIPNSQVAPLPEDRSAGSGGWLRPASGHIGDAPRFPDSRTGDPAVPISGMILPWGFAISPFGLSSWWACGPCGFFGPSPGSPALSSPRCRPRPRVRGSRPARPPPRSPWPDSSVGAGSTSCSPGSAPCSWWPHRS